MTYKPIKNTIQTMNDIKSLYDAAMRYDNKTIQVDGNRVELFLSWNVGNELYAIMVNGKLIHLTKRNRIKKILTEWMEGKRKLENELLIKC